MVVHRTVINYQATDALLTIKVEMTNNTNQDEKVPSLMIDEFEETEVVKSI